MAKPPAAPPPRDPPPFRAAPVGPPSPERNLPDLLRNEPKVLPISVTPPPSVSVNESSACKVPKEPVAPQPQSPAASTSRVEQPLQKVPPPPRKNPSPPKRQDSIPKGDSAKDTKVPPAPVSSFKIGKSDSKVKEKSSVKLNKQDVVVPKEVPAKNEKVVAVTNNVDNKESKEVDSDASKMEVEKKENAVSEESNGVGDKIKKFEKAAEDASATVSVGRLSRAGSVRGRAREDITPPAKETAQFDFTNAGKEERCATVLERQQSLKRNSSMNLTKWQKNGNSAEVEKVKPEPQKIVKPEFKPLVSPAEVTIRSPSLGAKLPDQFPSQGTAFRNVAALHKPNEDVNTHNSVKTCKFKNKEKYSVSKGSSYFTRGSEEIWLVKKKDIEEIEERVLDSFRRAGGNICMRSESMRPSSDSGQGSSFSHATMGRSRRQMYARSESLDPQGASARAQTLKRQSSVACTCGHDKKTRPKATETAIRPRSRSHGDDSNQSHVLDKYETLV